MKEINNQEILFKIPPTTELKKCYKCGSVYINDDQCLTCGIQFKTNLLGESLGIRSFYWIKSQYYEAKTIPYLRINFGKKSRIYKRKILMRMNILLDSFLKLSPYSIPLDYNRKIFYIEIRDVFSELIYLGVKRDFLIKIIDERYLSASNEVDDKSLDLIYSNLKKLFASIKNNRNFKSYLSLVLNYKIGNLLKVKNIIFFLVGFLFFLNIVFIFNQQLIERIYK